MMEGPGRGERGEAGREGAAPPWRAHVEALFALLDESRPRAPSRAEIAAIVADEAGDALTHARVQAIADRLARAL